MDGVWAPTLDGDRETIFNCQAKMQGFVHFSAKTILVARNRHRGGLNRPPKGLKT